MACTVQRDPVTKEIQKVLSPNGKESILFKELNNQLGDKEKALDAYSYVYTDNFINSFGNWLEDNTLSDLLDDNREPLLEHALNPPIKANSGITVPGYTEIEHKEITDLLINRYVNSVKSIENKGGKVKTGKLLNSIKNSFLREAFSNLDGSPYTGDLKILQEYLKNVEEVEKDGLVYLSPNDTARRILKLNNIQAASPLAQGYPTQDNHEVLLDIHDQWFDVVEGREKNIERLGFQTMMANRMKTYGLKMTLGQENLEELEDGSLFERIYSRARVQEDMRSKISQGVKTFLATIESDQTGSLLGYKTYIPFEIVYADLQNGLAGSLNFAEMVSRMKTMSKTKPHIKTVLDTLMQKDENLKSAFHFTFALNKNEFILFKETPQGLIIMDARRNSLQNKYMSSWRANSVQKEGSLNLRHLYKVKEDEEGIQHTLNKEVARSIVNSWNKMQDIYELDNVNEISPKLITEMVSFLRGFGVDLASGSLDKEIAALTSYLKEGDTSFSKGKQLLQGVALYKAMLQNEDHQLIRLVDAIAGGKKVRRKFVNFKLKDSPQNVYTSHSGILNKFTAIPLSSETDMFGSFINAKGNSIFPINLTTVMDDLILDLKGRDANFFDDYYKDVFFNPIDSKITTKGAKMQSLWLQLFNSKTEKGNLTQLAKKTRQNFRIVGLDALRKQSGKTLGFKELNKKNSMYLRMAAFLNSGGKAGHTFIAIPNLADRSRMDFIELPTIERAMDKLKMSEEDLIKGFIIQDLVRAQSAEMDMENLPDDRLIPNFHYDVKLMKDLGITDKRDPRVLGNAFRMQQFNVVEDNAVTDRHLYGAEFKLSTVDWNAYVAEKPLSVNRALVEDALQMEIDKVKDYINTKSIEVQEEYLANGLIRGRNLNNLSNKYNSLEDLFRSFTLNNMVHKLENQKFTRGGIAFNKDYVDFSKRYGNMQTPGYKLLLKGELGKGFEQWGFFNEFNEGIMSDFFTTPEVYDEIGDSITQGLMEIEGMSLEDAAAIGNLYKGGQSNKSDAFGVMDLTTFKAMREGMGQWPKEDEEAYQNYVNAPEGSKRYIDNNGQPRRLEPIKQYYDRMVFVDGRMVAQNTKNSYMVLTEEFTRGVNRATPLYPTADLIRQRMERTGPFRDLTPMHVINTDSTKKLARIGTVDLNANPIEGLTNMSSVTLPGKGFRIPQIVPEKKAGKKGLLGRQFMINIIAGVDLASSNQDYSIDGQGTLTGNQVFELYNHTIATMVDTAYSELMGELGFAEYMNAKGEEKQIAKLKMLQNLRDTLRQEAVERELPENYIKALDIIKNEKGEWRFKMPLAFPNFKRRFEGIIMGVLKKRVVKQKINGGSAKQIAELGGHVTSDEVNIPTELKFVRYEDGRIKHAEVAIRADIAKQYGLRPGMDLSQIPERLRTLIAYRIPNQSKNSDIPLIIAHILPDNYDQAIVVPGGITTQMGSDFDIDTLYLLMPNVKLNKETNKYEKITVDYKDLFDSDGSLNMKNLQNLGRPSLENIIIDVAESILTSRKHFKEVVTPLDSPDLKNIEALMKEELGLAVEFDHNDPMTEVRLEEINKDGLAGVGIYANALTGKNISQYTTMRILGHTPTIDGINYSDLKRITDNKSTSNNSTVQNRPDDLIEFNISKRISSSVDNAKDPGMYYRNDNYFTGVVHTLFDSVGINEYDTHNFMNQPILRALTEVYKAGEFTPNMIYNAVSQTLAELDISEGDFADIKNEIYAGDTFNMDSQRLQVLSNEEGPITVTEENQSQQLKYLANFVEFFKTGRGLNKAYKVLNQDKGADSGTFGGLLEFKGLHESVMEEKVISGVEGVVNGSEYPMQRAYARAIERMLNFGGEFFIHQKQGVRTAKEHIRVLLNKDNLTESDHRNIEEAMLLYAMSNNENTNPLQNVFTEDNITRLLLNGSTSLLSTLQKLKNMYPSLNENAFIANIIEHPENLRTDTPLTRVRFQNLYSFAKFEKDMFSDGLRNLFLNPGMYTEDAIGQEAITALALDFVRVSLLSSGYTPGHDTFIDLIPIEMQSRSANYFYNEFDNLDASNYFGSDFTHKFVRNFYYTDIVPNIKVKAGDVSRAIASGNYLTLPTQDSRIFSREFGKPVSYFTVNTRDGKVLFVLETSNSEVAAYAKSSTLGIPYGLKEMNIYDAEGKKLTKSVGRAENTGRFVRTKGSETRPALSAKSQRQIRETITRQDEQAEKNCI